MRITIAVLSKGCLKRRTFRASLHLSLGLTVTRNVILGIIMIGREQFRVSFLSAESWENNRW